MHTIASFVLAASLSGLAAAQVSPSHFTRASGTGFYSALGVYTGASRVLQVDGSLAGPMTIRQISFRPWRTTLGAVPARDVIVTLTMSHAATTPSTISQTFAANHGTDRVTALLNQRITLSALPADETQPGPFSHTIVLPTPFQYTGSAPLCWEIEAFNVVPSIDYYEAFGAASPSYSVRSFLHGSGCYATSRSRFAHSDLLSRGIGTAINVQTRCSSGPPLSTGAVLLGFSAASLPLPTTASGSSGVCLLNTNPVASLPTFLDGIGFATSQLSFTLSPSMNGLSLRTQYAALDSSANALGVVTSNAVALHVIAPYAAFPISVVTGQPGIPTGAAAPNSGVIVEFR